MIISNINKSKFSAKKAGICLVLPFGLYSNVSTAKEISFDITDSMPDGQILQLAKLLLSNFYRLAGAIVWTNLTHSSWISFHTIGESLFLSLRE